MPDPVRPGRDTDSLADVVELLLDKGVVLNADIVVSVGETELLGIRLRAALASFETASEYGLEFPSGTDMEAVEAASQRRRRSGMSPSARPELDDGDDDSVDVMNATVGAEDDEQSASGESTESEDGAADDADEETDDERRTEGEQTAESASGDDDGGNG